MPRRRAERQQEKEEFLQQNPELITFTTRIEVDADGGEDAVFSQDGGPFEEAGIDDFEGGNDSFILVDGIFGPTFEIRAFELHYVLVKDLCKDIQISAGAMWFHFAPCCAKLYKARKKNIHPP